ncbi:MAG: sigma-70 family RNA polymerase sigma factor [Proteobacteria bacterium]|nr:sigma-70 family RNA polymerase sigma factor [Pseudomonadota bacterium]MBU4296189.1 sigma-70 family RNA polymerase sigma factor [Pseudomonadota bacterium]MCG2749651.1 sigma-70 family RNA polymerase sigma factor [Desulfobulbaceae bacterium]
MNKDELKKDTEQLVQDFLDGDAQAFNRLVLLYQTKIYNLALNYVKSPEEAQDLAQDIFVTVYRSLPKLREKNKFSSWLYQIAINHCRNRYKKLCRRGYFSNISLDDEESFLQIAGDEGPEKLLQRKNTITLVRATIDSMAEAEKEIILLRDIQELAYEEISDILDIPLGTVKSKLNRARTSLKDRLKKHYQDL